MARSKYDTQKYVSVEQAIELSNIHGITISRPTIIKWCRSEEKGGFGIGIQPSGHHGKWYVHRKKFLEVLNGSI